MPEDASEFPTCLIEQTFVRPHIERLTRDTNAAHTQLRDHGAVIEKLLLWRDESGRRITLLEQGAVEQRQESRRVDKAIGDLKSDMASLRDHVNGEFTLLGERVDNVSAGVGSLMHRFNLHANEMKEAHAEATKRHERMLRVGMTIASSFAALAAVLIALHGAISGVPMLETIKELLPK